MLITISRGGDQLRKRYPDAINGGELGMNPIFRTERYVLLSVSETRPAAEGAARPGEVVPNTNPEPAAWQSVQPPAPKACRAGRTSWPIGQVYSPLPLPA